MRRMTASACPTRGLGMPPWLRWHVWLIAVGLCLAAATASAQNALPNFVDELVAGGLSAPTALAFAPDGRVVITEQGGTARVVENDKLVSEPLATFKVDSRGERGLLGVAFHPKFANNRYIYFYHTVPASGSKAPFNQITRYKVSGNKVVASSAKTILTLNPLSSRTNHNGGAIHFGKDGKLYVAVGDNDNGTNAQSLNTRLGKILRLNADGSIPSGNSQSFPGTSGNTSGDNRAIWALGVRNPYTFAFHPLSGDMIINDVGENKIEEVNRGIAGRNYGWPNAEGPSSNSKYTNPIYYYRHGSGTPQGCAVTGGTFYSPPQAKFPATYVDKYFFADYCGNWIYYIDPAKPGSATLFASGLSEPVDLDVGDDGALYYVQRGKGQLRRIRYTSQDRQRIQASPQQFEITEGTTKYVAVQLGSQPGGNVTVNIDRSLSDYLITSSPSSLTFTPSNWNKPQNITVTAKQDGDQYDEGARLSLWSSGIPSVRIRITAVDDDRPAGAPRAVISRPLAGDTVRGATAEFFGGDGGYERAEFYVDKVLQFRDPKNKSGHFHLGGDHNMWNTKALSNGAHTLWLKVFDANGKSAIHEIRVKVAN